MFESQLGPGPHRSQRFYHLSGDIVVQVEATLYRLHCDILSKFSAVFKDILSIPNGGEGCGDDNPIRLETIKQAEFDCLMSWIYEADLRHTPPGGGEQIHFIYDTLVSVLKLATLYQMTAARTWAIERIKAEETITAAQRMHLAEQYSIPDWVRPAVQELLRRPVLSYSSAEIELLSPSVALVLAKAQAKFFETLLALTSVAPDIHHALHCEGGRRARCEAVWKESWWTKVARFLLFPPQQHPELSKLCDFITTIPSLDAMTLSCKVMAVQDLRDSAVLDFETRILEKAVESIQLVHSRYIVAYYTNNSGEN